MYLRTTPGSSKTYHIQTQEVSGKPKPDTKITLYEINFGGSLGSVVATNDDISGTVLFSKITPTLNGSSNYVIKIENKVTSTADTRSKGHYYLRIDACYDKTSVSVNGNTVVCSNQQYTVNNLPVGATVSWTTTLLGYPGLSQSGNVATLASSGNTILQLNATIFYCGETYTVSLPNIKIGLPTVLFPLSSPYPIAQLGDEEGSPSNVVCYSASKTHQFSISDVTNGTVSWQKMWSIPASWSFWSGGTNTVSVMFKGANQTALLKRTITNSCGSVEEYYGFNSNSTQCPQGLMMMMAGGNQTLKVYPNPTSVGNTITLELFLEEEQIDFENATIQLIDSKNKIVFEQIGTKELKEQLKIPSMSNGTYYISVANNNGTVSEELIINNGQ